MLPAHFIGGLASKPPQIQKAPKGFGACHVVSEFYGGDDETRTRDLLP